MSENAANVKDAAALQDELLIAHKNRFAIEAFRVFAIGGVLSSLSFALQTICDALIVGNAYGEYGLAVTSVIMPLYMLFNLISISFGLGGAARVSSAFGQGDREGAQGAFCRCISVTLLLSVLLGAFGLLFTRQLASVLGGGALGGGCLRYIRWICAFAPCMILTPVLFLFLQCDADPFFASVSSVVSVLVNLVLDLVFVSWLNIGIEGAAIAMAAGQLCGLCVCLFHFKKKTANLSLRAFKLAMKGSFRLFSGGIGTASYYAWLFLQLLLYNRVMTNRFGTEGMAVFNIVFNLSSLGFALFNGIALSLSVLVSTYKGEKDRQSTSTTMRAACKTTVFAGFALTALLLIFASPLVKFFGVQEARTLSSGIVAARLYAVAILPACLASVFCAYYQAMGLEREVLFTSLLRTLLLPALFLLPSLYVLSEAGCALSLSLAELASLLPLYLLVRVKMKQREASDILLLQQKSSVTDDADASQEEIVYETFMENDYSELPQIIENVERFCRENGINTRLAYSIQLTIEELSTNIIHFGFNDNKPHALDIKLAKYGEEIFVRIRDNAGSYNPFDHKGAEGDANAMDYVGVELIRAKAKDFQYQRRLIYNNLLIVL